MKWLLTTIISLAAAVSVNAEGPQLELSHYEYDLGVFDRDSLQTAHIVMRNVGTDTLTIYRVFTSCRCTRHADYRKKVAPGDSTILTVTYDGSGYTPGRIRQTVRIKTNSTEKPFSTCYIIGEIKRPTQK